MITRKVESYNLSDAFFSVAEMPVFINKLGLNKVIRGFKAIVDIERENTLSVVSSKYRLVSNKEAYEMTDHVIQIIFENKTLRDFQCFNIYMPKTRGSCRMDLIMPNNFKKLFGKEMESWTPFIRISNSYNRTMTLQYKLGFCRWICKNGVIFGQKGIKLSMTHSGGIPSLELLLKSYTTGISCSSGQIPIFF